MSKKETFLNILRNIAPVVLTSLPGPAGVVARAMAPAIMQGVMEAQQIPGASNTEKKAHALNVVQAGLAAIHAEGQVQLPETDVMSAASSAIDTVIATAHVVDGTHIAVPQPAMPAAPAVQ